MRNISSFPLFFVTAFLFQPLFATAANAYNVTSANTSSTSVTPGQTVTLSADLQADSAVSNMIVELAAIRL